MRVQTDSGRSLLAAVEATAEQTAARLNDVPDISRGLNEGNVQEAGRKFEALFLSMMAKEMRQTLPNGLFGGGPGADTYEGWFDQHMGELLAQSEPLGLIGILKAGMAGPGTLRLQGDPTLPMASLTPAPAEGELRP